MSDGPVRLARPCTARNAIFEDRGDGTRFCHHCREVTHDLRDATRSEAEELYRANGDKLCARANLDAEGFVRFRPERPRLTAMGSAAIALALAACGGEPTSTTAPPPTTPTVTPVTPTPPPAPAPTPTSEPTQVATPEEVAAEPIDDGIDHSTDDSPDLDDHRTHRHRHPPAFDDGPLGGFEF